jgi:hypothetical protein
MGPRASLYGYVKFHQNPKICPVGAELFHADRRTDMTKLTVAFRNFANVLKKEKKKRKKNPVDLACVI